VTAPDVLLLIAQADLEPKLSSKAQIFAVIAAVIAFIFVVELVRRRRLVERYALLWMTAATVGLVLSVWAGGLDWIAARLGIASPPNALFLLGLVAVFGLLLNFSVAISRLSEETKILAQTVSRLDAELRAQRTGKPGPNGGGPGSADRSAGRSASDEADQPPVAGEQSGEQS